MRLMSIDAFDDDERPTLATFQLTRDEVALLYRYAATVAPVDVSKASGESRWADVNDGVASCSANFFNRFWEGGVDDVAPGFSVRSLYAVWRERVGER